MTCSPVIATYPMNSSLALSHNSFPWCIVQRSLLMLHLTQTLTHLYPLKIWFPFRLMIASPSLKFHYRIQAVIIQASKWSLSKNFLLYSIYSIKTLKAHFMGFDLLLFKMFSTIDSGPYSWISSRYVCKLLS